MSGIECGLCGGYFDARDGEGEFLDVCPPGHTGYICEICIEKRARIDNAGGLIASLYKGLGRADRGSKMMDKTDAPVGGNQPDEQDHDREWIYRQKQDWAIGDICRAARDLRLNPCRKLKQSERQRLNLALEDIGKALNNGN